MKKLLTGLLALTLLCACALAETVPEASARTGEILRCGRFLSKFCSRRGFPRRRARVILRA